MRNKKADAFGLATLLVVVVAVGVAAGKVLGSAQYGSLLGEASLAEIADLAQPLLFTGALALLVAWLAVSTVLESHKDLRAELDQTRAEISALREAMTAAEQDRQALPAGGEPEIEFR